MLKLRIHIAPVGFEIDRIMLPLVKLKADRVWLMTGNNSEKDAAQPYLNKIIRKLEKKKIEYRIEKSEIRDLFDALNGYRKIIQQEEGNQILINVSTGTKIQSIAAMMACMMFKTKSSEIKPYYVEPEKYVVKPIKQQPMTSGCKRIFLLPNYKIEKPSENLISALKIISKLDKISKRELILACTSANIIRVKENAKNPRVAEHSALNANVIAPLLGWGFIELEGKGKRGRVKITEDGKNALKFLG